MITLLSNEDRSILAVMALDLPLSELHLLLPDPGDDWHYGSCAGLGSMGTLYRRKSAQSWTTSSCSENKSAAMRQLR